MGTAQHSTGLSSCISSARSLQQLICNKSQRSSSVSRKAAAAAASMANKCIATVLAVAAVLTVAAASSNAPDADALRFPGRPSSRPRNPVFPGYPRARPSPPIPGSSSSSSSSSVPSAPSSPTPSVPSSPVSPAAPCARPVPVMPQLPGFPGLGGGSGSIGSGGSGGGSGSPPSSSSSSSPTDCVTPLAGLMTCGTFLTGSEPETPTPQSECCAGLGAFLNTSSAAAPGDDHTLRCLCPVILGDVNKMLPKPVDPVRMMYLPIACGVVLPPQVLYICFTGQQSPPLVGRIPDVWEKPNSALSP